MALSMRCNAIRRPPLSHTAALILMLSSCAFAKAPRMMRLASSNVRLIVLSLARNIVGRASIVAGRRREPPSLVDRHDHLADWPERDPGELQMRPGEGQP